jgi:uroporphyrinogen-III synthase
LDKIGDWKHLPVLAVSDSTAKAARKNGAELLDIGDGYGKSIVGLVKEKYPDLKGVHPHAKVPAYDIEKALMQSGISVDAFVVYETSCLEHKAVELPFDAICIFTSPSSVKCFENLYSFLPTYKIICIGETTRSALPEGVDALVSHKTSVLSSVERAKSLSI